MRDPRGSHSEAGQGGQGSIGSLPRCHFCGEQMIGQKLPDHVRKEHVDTGGLGDD